MARAKLLRLSADLSLPVDFASAGVLVTGMRGSGKSNTEARFAELLYAAEVPWFAVDPKGDWHGVRSSGDGKKPGMSVPIFGGLYGDFPLNPKMGARIADLLVDENLSAVLDVSLLSKTGDLPTFLTPFFNQLIHRHQMERHVRTAILEEAHRYIPQTVKGATAELKEAAAAVLLEGRAWGLGCWAATQRPARLHKDVVEEVDNAIIHRVGVAATNDKKTIGGWVKHYELSDDIVDSLTVLGNGEAWVLMPQDGLVRRVQMDRRTTFDSAATPKVGARIRRPATMAEIDPAAITAALEDVIERAKADDPKELRRENAELRRQLAEVQQDRPAPDPVVERIDVPVLDEDLVIRVEQALEPFAGLLGEVQERLTWETTQRGEVIEFERKLHDRSDVPRARPASRLARDGEHKPAAASHDRRRVAAAAAPKRAEERPDSPQRRDAHRPSVPGTPPADVRLPEGELKVLTAAAQHPDGVTREQATILTGYKRSTRDAYIQRLRGREYVDVTGGRVVATDTGVAALGDDFEPLPTGSALRAHWLAKLPEGEGRVLAVLVEAYPSTVSRDDVSEATGYKRSTRDAYIQRLRLRQLVVLVAGEPAAADDLFD